MAAPSRSHSRVPSTVTCMSDKAPSTVTCATDLQADIPIPNVEDVNKPEAASSSSRPAKRKFDGPEGDESRAADPEDPQDAGMVEVPKVWMLGERLAKNGKTGEFAHGGVYDLVELFSPPRIAERARARGLRGGWSLDRACADPITGQRWNLSDSATQSRVWKMIRRDQPLVIGLSPECTLFSALQSLRKTSIPEGDMTEAIECIRFSVEVANYQRKEGRFFILSTL